MTELNDATRQRLRQLRESLGMSRPKFAEQLGIPPTTL
ncbi:helix-turn-helix domain-containing protein, partial [Aeromonas rivuli]